MNDAAGKALVVASCFTKRCRVWILKEKLRKANGRTVLDAFNLELPQEDFRHTGQGFLGASGVQFGDVQARMPRQGQRREGEGRECKRNVSVA